MKVCCTCKVEQPLENFGRSSQDKDGLKPRCKSCRRAEQRGYYERNRPAILRRHYAYSKANRKKLIVAERKRKGSAPKVYGSQILARSPQTEDGCRQWMGHVDPRGYPRAGAGLAHRLALRVAGVAIPEDYHVHHECGNRSCVNVAHLRILSASDHNALHREQVAA